MSQYILEEIYPDFADLYESVPGIDANITFKELNATALSSRKVISDIISPGIWDKVKAETGNDSLMYLRSAYANLLMFKYKIFDTVQSRHSNQANTYKYELEAMKRQYIDNYHNAMDSLLRILAGDDSYGWNDTFYAQQLQKIKIKDILEFQSYYYIDTSFLYFIRTIPIQRKELLHTFNGYYEKIAARQDLLDNVNYALVYTVIARSLQQFDLIEFPPTIRNYFDDNTLNRNGKDEHDAMLNMANNMLNEASGFLNNVDLALMGDEETDIYTGNTDNDECNKYYFPG